MDLELGRPNRDRPPFRYSALTRVQFSDTDAQGVVYYGRYLPYFDLARVEYLRHLRLGGMGAGSAEVVMRAMTVEYLAPARFDDLLEVFIRTLRIGRTSFTQELAAYRRPDDTLMCRAEQTLVMIDVPTHRPIPIPDEWRRVVTEFDRESMEAQG